MIVLLAGSVATVAMAVLLVGITGLLRGRVAWAMIESRPGAGLVTAVGFTAAVAAFGAMAPSGGDRDATIIARQSDGDDHQSGQIPAGLQRGDSATGLPRAAPRQFPAPAMPAPGDGYRAGLGGVSPWPDRTSAGPGPGPGVGDGGGDPWAQPGGGQASASPTGPPGGATPTAGPGAGPTPTASPSTAPSPTGPVTAPAPPASPVQPASPAPPAMPGPQPDPDVPGADNRIPSGQGPGSGAGQQPPTPPPGSVPAHGHPAPGTDEACGPAGPRPPDGLPEVWVGDIFSGLTSRCV
ncbi:hypothetical protein BBK14_18575 [Parafrankia soli]|uniref:Uncharacterized protein n=1 Tax=Parafrankia soli TaxID=2599596 RepID=A0A1S1Q311_9ACTN|nr:hypothetical protein [Parafrankia soli]OHV27969.1 hypothetical protein BBK14_18575 [Parafrankia soli]